jgi:hypothetical protein
MITIKQTDTALFLNREQVCLFKKLIMMYSVYVINHSKYHKIYMKHHAYRNLVLMYTLINEVVVQTLDHMTFRYDMSKNNQDLNIYKNVFELIDVKYLLYKHHLYDLYDV